MRIAQVSPLYESVPPRLYGGTERVVAYLVEALIDLGHDVTLFASGDSRTRARLVAPVPEALRLANRMNDSLAWHYLELREVIERSGEFDLVHFHTDYLHVLAAPLMRAPQVLTLHGRLDLPELAPLYRRFRETPLVSISHAQRAPLPFARWLATVHHGLPRNLYRPGDGRGGYLAFLGRIAREKRPDRAIEIARRCGLPLRIAAKIEHTDRAYFERDIKPLLRGADVEFVGEIGEAQKQRFLGDARALLFPIDWPEPFGLVMIEALACGTPIVAFAGGSVGEVVEPDVSGYVVESVDAAVDAVLRTPRLSREACRARFEARFTADRMARDYAALYELLARHPLQAAS